MAARNRTLRAALLVRQGPDAGMRIEHATRRAHPRRETRAAFRWRGTRSHAYRSRPCRVAFETLVGRADQEQLVPRQDEERPRDRRLPRRRRRLVALRRTAARRCGCPSYRRSSACAESARAPRRPRDRPRSRSSRRSRAAVTAPPTANRRRPPRPRSTRMRVTQRARLEHGAVSEGVAHVLQH